MGDASLWYLIANANGLSAGADVPVGMNIVIPSNQVHNFHNNSATFKVYDPNAAIGDVSPTAPEIPPAPPPPVAAKPWHDPGCGIFGQIIVAVVAVVVTAVTLNPAIGFATSSLGLGSGIAADVIGGALAGAAGGIVSQTVGTATGIQNGFNWGAVGLAAVGGAVAGGLASTGFFNAANFGSDFNAAVASGVAGSALSQGIDVAVGLQRGFDWAGVAAAGVGAGVGSYVGGQLAGAGLSQKGAQFGASTASLIANAATRSLVSGSDFGDNIIAALPDTIGQTVGNLVAGAASDQQVADADPYAGQRKNWMRVAANGDLDGVAADPADADEGFFDHLWNGIKSDANWLLNEGESLVNGVTEFVGLGDAFDMPSSTASGQSMDSAIETVLVKGGRAPSGVSTSVLPPYIFAWSDFQHRLGQASLAIEQGRETFAQRSIFNSPIQNFRLTMEGALYGASAGLQRFVAGPSSLVDATVGRLLESPYHSRFDYTNAITAAGSLALGGAGVMASRGTVLATEELPTIVFSKAKTPGISSNIEAALAEGRPSVLTRLEGRDAIRAQRIDALDGQVRPSLGYSLDEYPFASTQEGGSGARVSQVPIREQNIQGGMLSSFYQKYGINHGDPFEVVVAPKCDNAMNISLEILVDRIFDHLRLGESMVADRRRIGVSAVHIEQALHEQKLHAPSGLIRLYTYCDGTSTFQGEILDKIQFFPGFYWMNLDDLLLVYQAISKNDKWDKSWLPIFASGGGDFYAIVCDQLSPYFGQIVGFILGEPDQIVEFSSISAMFGTIEQSFAKGAFFFVGGKLKADYPKMRAIARQLQPDFIEHEA